MAEQVKQEFHITISGGQITITNGFGGFVPSGDIRMLIKALPGELQRRHQECDPEILALLDSHAREAAWVFPETEAELRYKGPCVYFMGLRGGKYDGYIKIGQTVQLWPRFRDLRKSYLSWYPHEDTVAERVIAFAKTAYHLEYERLLLERFRLRDDKAHETASARPVLDYLAEIRERLLR